MENSKGRVSTQIDSFSMEKENYSSSLEEKQLFEIRAATPRSNLQQRTSYIEHKMFKMGQVKTSL